MSENLYNSAHKATNEAYREGYDGIQWDHSEYWAQWKVKLTSGPLCFTEEVLDDAEGFGTDGK